MSSPPARLSIALIAALLAMGISSTGWTDLEPANHVRMPIHDQQPTDDAQFPDPVVLENGNISRTTGEEGGSVHGWSFLSINLSGYKAEYAGDHGDTYPYDPDALEDSQYGLQFDVEGQYPESLSFPGEPVVLIRPGRGLELNWADGDTHTENIDITVTATWVDRYGRQGPTSDPLHLSDSGTGLFSGCSGCSSSAVGTTPAAVFAVLIFFAAARLRRLRRPRFQSSKPH